ncbi:MAG: tRNA 5-methoxyuridine(34)/uridine 5-oxyacetic acid(34) synthase CmoB [Wenzhouxiangellaceae bacterium]
MIDKWFSKELADRLQQLRQEPPAPHGDAPRWQAALSALPEVQRGWHVEDGVLVAGAPAADPEALAGQLKTLIPWRKGPLRLGGVLIDTEWRSDWKWHRIKSHLDLHGACVLDIGAGNSYFGWRMLEAGAAVVIGCDPMALYWHQFRAIAHFAGEPTPWHLPVPFETLPETGAFDVVFSMGVLYHRREPLDHLQRIRRQLRTGGRLVLETLVIAGDDDTQLDPRGRYANMRNVHALPSLGRLTRWLHECGFEDIEPVDCTVTECNEQRRTEWMPFHSLAEALAADGRTTIEGHPRPLRAFVVARTP